MTWTLPGGPERRLRPSVRDAILDLASLAAHHVLR
jgi:hypothetical protein